MNSALTWLFPKPKQDPTLSANYRPISLTSTDIKIISQVLASRIESITSRLIYSDHTNFIKGRHSSNILQQKSNVAVQWNSTSQKTFTLQQGTRQEFSLFPSLFVLDIEPLAIAIHQNNNIKGFINKPNWKIRITVISITQKRYWTYRIIWNNIILLKN